MNCLAPDTTTLPWQKTSSFDSSGWLDSFSNRCNMVQPEYEAFAITNIVRSSFKNCRRLASPMSWLAVSSKLQKSSEGHLVNLYLYHPHPRYPHFDAQVCLELFPIGERAFEQLWPVPRCERHFYCACGYEGDYAHHNDGVHWDSNGFFLAMFLRLERNTKI